MNELIKVQLDENKNQVVSGRDLHMFLEVSTPYHKWFPRMCEYGFEENVDYSTVDKFVHRSDGAVMPQKQYDHLLTISMAKQIAMLQRTPKGKEAREYFIAVENAWNTPELIFARALEMANAKIASHEELIAQQVKLLEAAKPKVIFADAVDTAKTSILIGDLAKLLKQNGYETGQKRLFSQLREEGYLMKGGSSYNMPTQRAMEMGLFEVKEHTVNNYDGSVRLTRTVKVTGKGQIYFVNKYAGQLIEENSCLALLG